jgi:tRNA dimethylallyltransferase
MNIGTATPTKDEQDRVKHYNISIIDPSIKDSAAAYYERAMKWEHEIKAKGKHILYVGGSTLHQQCIIKPFDDIPNADEGNIKELEQRIEEEGIASLFAQLEQLDPEYAASMDGMNPQRIVRALDVWMQTGRPFSSFHTNDSSFDLPVNTMVFGFHRDRQHLYERINRRVDLMFKQGFLDEVRSILDKGYSLQDPGLNTVGYKEAVAHLKGTLSRKQMVKDMKTQTRRYAKRQITWFKRWDFVEWINLDKYGTENAAEKVLQHLAAKSNKD